MHVYSNFWVLGFGVRQDAKSQQALRTAEFKFKASQRPDLYELLGVKTKERASEREIRAGYKRKGEHYWT